MHLLVFLHQRLGINYGRHLLQLSRPRGIEMLFSKGKDQPAEATSSSTAAAPASASSTAPAVSPVDDAEWQAKGAAGLGAIASLSPDCTPLKHRYDSCFNLWLKDYLAIGDDQIRDQQRLSEASARGLTASLASTSSGSSGGKKNRAGSRTLLPARQARQVHRRYLIRTSSRENRPSWSDTTGTAPSCSKTTKHASG